MKICTKCGESKPPEQFYAMKRSADGLYPHCRSCHLGYTANWARLHPDKKREYSKAHYWRNPDRKRAAALKYHYENRPTVISAGRVRARDRWLRCIAGLGGACECCGEKNISMLEIDHRHGFGNAHRRLAGGSVGVYCDIIKRNFPKDEFGVLCCNCNQSKRRNGGLCQHKTEPSTRTFDRFKQRFDQHLAELVGAA